MPDFRDSSWPVSRSIKVQRAMLEAVMAEASMCGRVYAASDEKALPLDFYLVMRERCARAARSVRQAIRKGESR